jgi:hypothetical protein
MQLDHETHLVLVGCHNNSNSEDDTILQCPLMIAWHADKLIVILQNTTST